ncbi:MAG: helix-turn-helix domain-containing protein [Pseudomonadota bacterium]
MTNRRPFKEVKLQWLQLLSCDPKLSDTARSVALYIVTTHINGHTEKAWPSYSTIANAMGKSVKTIQRAVSNLELAGWFKVVRGNGVGQSTQYTPTESSIIAATEAREKTDKVVHLNPIKGGQNCPERQTIVSTQGRQNCPPNPENIKNKKPNARESARPPGEGRPAISALFIAEHEFHKLEHWRSWFQEMGLLSLEKLAPRDIRNGRMGFSLPSYFPPGREDKNRFQAVLDYFKRLEFLVLNDEPQMLEVAS